MQGLLSSEACEWSVSFTIYVQRHRERDSVLPRRAHRDASSTLEHCTICSLLVHTGSGSAKGARGCAHSCRKYKLNWKNFRKASDVNLSAAICSTQ